MKQKVLVHAETMTAKKIILPTILSVGYDFVEAHDYYDVRFKCDLLKDHIAIYIHELDYTKYDEDISHIKDVIDRGLKVVLIIDNYDVAIIDEALNIGIKDIVELPIDKNVFAKKLRSFIFTDKKDDIDISKAVEAASLTKHNEQIIQNEIARALRGGYEISMILVKHLNHDLSMTTELIKSLKSQLRDTDRVLHYADDKVLLICPFTVKAYIVEIENKVRHIYENLNKDKEMFALYGLTYPEDVNDSSKILHRLERGIETSIALSKLRGTLSDIGSEQFEAYKQMLT